MSGLSVDELIENFELLDQWEDRYRYIIDLGRALPPMAESDKTEANRVHGCVSQVWLRSDVSDETPPRIHFAADSDAFTVKGLVAILMMVYQGRTADEILAADIRGILDRLGLEHALSPSRSNGLYAMVKRIRALAGHHAAGATLPA